MLEMSKNNQSFQEIGKETIKKSLVPEFLYSVSMEHERE